MPNELRPVVPPELQPQPGSESLRISVYDGKKRTATMKVDTAKAGRAKLPTPEGSRLVVSRMDGQGRLISRGTAKAKGAHVDADTVAPRKSRRPGVRLPKPMKAVTTLGGQNPVLLGDRLGQRIGSIERRGNPLGTRRARLT